MPSNNSINVYGISLAEWNPAPTLEIKPMVVTDAFQETSRDESVYGCGWSLTELLNEW